MSPVSSADLCDRRGVYCEWMESLVLLLLSVWLKRESGCNTAEDDAVLLRCARATSTDGLLFADDGCRAKNILEVMDENFVADEGVDGVGRLQRWRGDDGDGAAIILRDDDRPCCANAKIRKDKRTCK